MLCNEMDIVGYSIKYYFVFVYQEKKTKIWQRWNSW